MFKTQKEIEENFDKKFCIALIGESNPNDKWFEVKTGVKSYDIQSFLHSVRAADKEAVEKWVKEAKKDNSKICDCGDKDDCNLCPKKKNSYYNSALSDLFTHLKDNWIIN